jgi:hypothetical protein
MADEAGLGLQGLPHVGIEGTFRDVAIDRDFLILAALPQDAAVALLDFGWLPGSVKMVQGNQTLLDIGAVAHFFGWSRSARGPTLAGLSRTVPVFLASDSA